MSSRCQLREGPSRSRRIARRYAKLRVARAAAHRRQSKRDLRVFGGTSGTARGHRQGQRDEADEGEALMPSRSSPVRRAPRLVVACLLSSAWITVADSARAEPWWQWMLGADMSTVLVGTRR